MALSNILNEPIKEISETGVGIAVLGIPVLLDFTFAEWMARGYVPKEAVDPPHWGMVAIVMAAGALAVFLGTLALVAIHKTGEGVINKVEAAKRKRRIREEDRARREYREREEAARWATQLTRSQACALHRIGR